MTQFKITNDDFIDIVHNNRMRKLIKNESFNNFNETILGLGTIGTKANTIEALSVIFDLEGFTDFCKQVDPHLAVPQYLNSFLKWIFSEIKHELICETFDDGYSTWADLPFLSKYLGDGLLFLWNAAQLSDVSINNIIVAMYRICKKYESDFLPQIAQKVTHPPFKLRCGIARGNIYSVGNGNDFVGPCINISARLQKLNSLSFCFSQRGIDVNAFGDDFSSTFVTKKVAIRGIGENELVCMSREEYDGLAKIEKDKFGDV
ncbi:MAG: hypothetical protein LBM68_02650 [Bacteroidales bacterium]|jgi:class 3 adenylate cyclase|nr:hypothetical protein [Bacteroidales bacterium]